MKKSKSTGKSAESSLRRLAEKALAEGPDENFDLSGESSEKMASLIHELRVHQIELTMQKEELQRIQEELEITKERFSHLYDFAPTGYVSMNEKGTITAANLTMTTLLGVERLALIGKMLSSYILGDDQDVFYKHRQRLIETEAPQTCELRLVKKGGSHFNARLECVIIKTKQDEFVEIRVSVSNITESKQAEEALLKSETRLRTLVHTIPDLVWLKDLNGVYLTCNPVFERFFGAEESEIVGKTDYDFVDKDLADFFREHDQRAMVAGRPSMNEEWLNFADNGYKGLFETIKSPMSDADGNLIGVLGIARDISERKNAENRLRDSEQRYKSAERMGQVGNWEYDLVTEKFWGSDQAKSIYGFDPESENFTTDEVENCILERERVHQALLDLIEQNTPYDLEFEIQPITGSPQKNVRSIAEVLFDENGTPQKVVGVIQDITMQKKAEKERILLVNQLKQSQKMESIGNLAGGIAHDFNNILASVIGFTELALDDVKQGTPLEDNLQEVYTAGKRAKDLVKQILAFARQSGEERKPIQVSTIVKEVLKLIRSTIPTTIEIKESIESHSLIMGNSSQVHQILMNLCTNAFQAMEHTGGILEVRLTDVEHNGQSPLPVSELSSGGYINLSISDNGPGISPDIIGFIFEPYFTTKQAGEGTGMGLAMTHGIVESYGGKITVESELGQGTVFKIYLPLTKKREDHRLYEKEKLPSGTESILFVDDELPIAKMGSQVLERLGYQVTVRTSSVEALELFHSKPHDFDLVITDMTMPNMSGDKLAMRLIAHRPDIPVILCTGYSKNISDEKAAKIGIKAIAYKPIVKADIAKTVRKVLDEAQG